MPYHEYCPECDKLMTLTLDEYFGQDFICEVCGVWLSKSFLDVHEEGTQAISGLSNSTISKEARRTYYGRP